MTPERITEDDLRGLTPAEVVDMVNAGRDRARMLSEALRDIHLSARDGRVGHDDYETLRVIEVAAWAAISRPAGAGE